ncbi:hypothetical protein PsorP6_006119 [Peronosclerospora sorghi]|uniref:Uncharacterized protein n=1 Tax=Peronosclerospora sorghi TaxID=230839 RepID=A0ACC0W552_9STRA|nr:hypothetical protein PsorP6_006119 [Peronosclerospora sorghi]
MAPSTCPLLIESRKLINSLGYIDTEYKSPLRQQQVQAQICAEMATFSPHMDEYLAFLPSYSPSFGGKTRLQAEFKRVSANVSLNAIDMRRYNVLEPTGKHAKSLEAWEQAVKQLQVAIEHQSSRVINLELQQGYGTKLAKVRTAVMGGMNQQYERAVEEVKAGSVEINRARQQDQMRNVAKLRSYHSKYLALLGKNASIRRTCSDHQQPQKKFKKCEQ